MRVTDRSVRLYFLMRRIAEIADFLEKQGFKPSTISEMYKQYPDGDWTAEVEEDEK